MYVYVFIFTCMYVQRTIYSSNHTVQQPSISCSKSLIRPVSPFYVNSLRRQIVRHLPFLITIFNYYNSRKNFKLFKKKLLFLLIPRVHWKRKNPSSSTDCVINIDGIDGRSVYGILIFLLGLAILSQLPRNMLVQLQLVLIHANAMVTQQTDLKKLRATLWNYYSDSY